MVKPSNWIFGKLSQSFSIFFSNIGTFLIVSLIFSIISFLIDLLFWFFSSWWIINLVIDMLRQWLQFIVGTLLFLVISKIIIDIIDGNKVNALDTIKYIFENAIKYMKITFSFRLKAYKVALILWLLLVVLSIYVSFEKWHIDWTLAIIITILFFALLITVIYLSLIYFAWSYIIFDKKWYNVDKIKDYCVKIWWKRRWVTLWNFIVLGIIVYVIYLFIVVTILKLFFSGFNMINIDTSSIVSLYKYMWIMGIIVFIVNMFLLYVIWQIIAIYTWLLYKQYDLEENSKINSKEPTTTEV